MCLSKQSACSIAAANSRLANLIATERAAVRCEAGCVECIDKFLLNQERDQRLKAGADASELLLRLAGASLQASLLEESTEKIAELWETVRVADEEGLATADAESELSKQEIEIGRLQNELLAGIFELNTKLNSLLGIDASSPQQIMAGHHFEPQLDPLNIEQQLAIGFSQRPDLNSLDAFGGCQSNSKCLSVLSNLDPRLGLKLASQISEISQISQMGPCLSLIHI